MANELSTAQQCEKAAELVAKYHPKDRAPDFSPKWVVMNGDGSGAIQEVFFDEKDAEDAATGSLAVFGPFKMALGSVEGWWDPVLNKPHGARLTFEDDKTLTLALSNGKSHRGSIKFVIVAD